MPSETPKMARTMAMAAHNPAKARRLGFKIPVKVAKDFNRADAKTGMLSRAMKKRGK